MTSAPPSALGRAARESLFWNQAAETMPRARLDALHLHRREVNR